VRFKAILGRAAAAGILLGALWAGPVRAHAEFVSAEPAPGSVLTHAPARLRLEFTETLRAGSGVVVYGTTFRTVHGVEAVVDLTQPTQLVVFLPELTPDNYTVQWTSVAADGDRLSGSYAFGVRPTAPHSALWRWVAVGGGGLAAFLAAGLVLWRRRTKLQSC
jgi:methionine-rich copper-binding protein CopC